MLDCPGMECVAVVNMVQRNWIGGWMIARSWVCVTSLDRGRANQRRSALSTYHTGYIHNQR
jgi:hypothetical protein